MYSRFFRRFLRLLICAFGGQVKIAGTAAVLPAHRLINTFGQRALLLALSLSVRVQHSNGHQGRWNEAALCSTKSS